MSDLRLLAVAPGSGALVRYRHLKQSNPDTTWDCVVVREEAFHEVYDWTDNPVVDLALTDRWPVDGEQQSIDFEGHPYLAYEQACVDLRSPLVTKTLWYSGDLPEMAMKVQEALEAFPFDYDGLVLWNDRCWYNEAAKDWAMVHDLPVIYVERATFPGMLVVDGTGLDAGHNDLELYRHLRADDEELRRWLSMAILQTNEAQPETTAGVVRNVIGNDPFVFVPLQVPYDTNLIFRAGEGGNNETLLRYAETIAQDGEKVVVKQHPRDWFTFGPYLNSVCHFFGLQLVDLGIHALLEQASKVVTYNSQVGIEAWMHGVEVEWLGEPAFVLDGLTPVENLAMLRFGYYVEPWQFGDRVRSILARKAAER
jgi:hypothetical protein